MHNAAINNEPLQGTSPFQKEVQERDALRNEVLVKVFPSYTDWAKKKLLTKKQHLWRNY